MTKLEISRKPRFKSGYFHKNNVLVEIVSRRLYKQHFSLAFDCSDVIYMDAAAPYSQAP